MQIESVIKFKESAMFLEIYDINVKNREQRERNILYVFILKNIKVFCSWALLHKTYTDGNFAINGNFHGNLEFDWLLSNVTM